MYASSQGVEQDRERAEELFDDGADDVGLDLREHDLGGNLSPRGTPLPVVGSRRHPCGPPATHRMAAARSLERSRHRSRIRFQPFRPSIA
jgi:hypothetical protein